MESSQVIHLVVIITSNSLDHQENTASVIMYLLTYVKKIALVDATLTKAQMNVLFEWACFVFARRLLCVVLYVLRPSLNCV